MVQMSKALENENIRRVDFIHAFTDDKNQPSTTQDDGPNLQDIGNFSNIDDDDSGDEKDSDSTARVAPVNVHTLRRLVEKKLGRDRGPEE